MSHVVLLLNAVKGHCMNSTKPFAEPDKAYLLIREMKKTQILVLSQKIANIGPWGYKKTMSHVVLLLNVDWRHDMNSTKPLTEPDKVSLMIQDIKKENFGLLVTKSQVLGSELTY